MPRVSVVTCTYNRAHLIGETIASVLAQSLSDFEYIIIDDGSDDDTSAVINSFQDARIHYFFHERTGGRLSVLRNFAQTKCSGEFIAYVDSDDLWEKDKLETQVRALDADRTIGFSFTDIDLFNKSGIIQKSLYKKTGQFTGNVFYQMLWNQLIICHTTLMIRNSCLDKTGPMDETLHSGDHDRVFFLSRYFNAFVIYKPLVHVRKHGQNSTSNPDLSFRLLEEHHQSLVKLLHQNLISTKEYKKAYIITSYSFGCQQLSAGNYLGARAYFNKCLSYNPFYWKAWARHAQLLSKNKPRG